MRASTIDFRSRAAGWTAAIGYPVLRTNEDSASREARGRSETLRQFDPFPARGRAAGAGNGLYPGGNSAVIFWLSQIHAHLRAVEGDRGKENG